MLKRLLNNLCIFILLTTASAALAVTPPIPDQPPAQVVDLAGIIEPAREEQLDRILRELEQKTTVQMVILTLTSLDNEDINTVSLRTAEKWKLGRRDKDNGLLFTVALKDRKYRFETGYGLESVLPDSLLGSLGRKTLVPWFKKGQYGQGIAAATGEIVQILSQQYKVEISGTDSLPKPVANGNQQGNLTLLFIFIVLFIIIVNARRQNRRNARGGPGVTPIIFPGGWGGGGGFGGGGFGGGFGGGGGGFGGGGASGGW